ncbi:MAG: hypothetical protein AW10_01807 [Candidatus Accumulibacter appositus]|uniref:Uncharacterized protein n=1 Tax=Candidatus Accumulibacter appositus TaxID=1454003 RepID=A0A011PU15_9PROT|nr:MAG: hypothetical protein AW10_01807 [Candidatus Accumulibacter appositus]
MVTAEPGAHLHSVEVKLHSLLGEGRTPHVENLGGFDAIVEAAPTLATSPLASEILLAVLRDVVNTAIEDARPWKELIGRLVHGATNDVVLIEMVDALDACQKLPDGTAIDVFMAFLQKAVNVSGTLPSYARAIALEGAFRLAAYDRRMQLRLLDALLGIQASDEPQFLRHAAKIMGIAHSHWREAELVEVLHTLSECEGAAYEASFELGMARLASALDEPRRDAANSLFLESLHWFRKAESMQEATPEASLYGECLTLLTDFEAHKTDLELRQRSALIQKSAFELVAWHADANSPAWLGARHFQAACWNDLAGTLASLANSLNAVSWWEPRVVIESQVLAAYSAGRTILKRSQDGSLETLIRPRLEASIAQREGQAYLLKCWLQQHREHERVPEANAILSGIDRLMADSAEAPRNPTEAATIWAPVAAVLSQAHCSDATKRRVSELVANAFAFSLENLSGAEIDIFDQCRSVVEAHPDHRGSLRGAKLFDTVLLWTVRFLKNRLEMTKKDDPSVSYLFEAGDGSLAPEGALQEDYFRWLSTQSASGEMEPTNLGSGRADVALKNTGERIVIEIKREIQDASFDFLAKAYAGQTTDYQNISIRLGFLLVLDLTGPKLEGTPHIRTLVQCRSIQRKGEAEPRQVVIVKVPGRRCLPSAISKIAKLSASGGKLAGRRPNRAKVTNKICHPKAP